MVQVKTGTWTELGDDAAAVRTDVFVHEQGIPVEMEWDELDAEALHAVAYDTCGQPVATGRLLRQGLQIAKIGRMAVKRSVRGSGLGGGILTALTDAARQRGDLAIVLHAQRSAQGFYLQAGFLPHGEPFDEADIPHIEMIKRLAMRDAKK